MATQDRCQRLCSGAPCPTPTLWSLMPTCRAVICGAGPDLAGAWPWPTLADRRSVCRYVQHYGLGEACDDIVSVLKRVAVKLGKTQKVKVLTGTGETRAGWRVRTPWGHAAALGAKVLERKGLCVQLQVPLQCPSSTDTCPRVLGGGGGGVCANPGPALCGGPSLTRSSPHQVT